MCKYVIKGVYTFSVLTVIDLTNTYIRSIEQVNAYIKIISITLRFSFNAGN